MTSTQLATLGELADAETITVKGARLRTARILERAGLVTIAHERGWPWVVTITERGRVTMAAIRAART